MDAESKKPRQAPKLQGERAALLDALAIGILQLLQGQDAKQSLEAARKDRGAFLKKAATALRFEATRVPPPPPKKRGRSPEIDAITRAKFEARVKEHSAAHGIGIERAAFEILKKTLSDAAGGQDDKDAIEGQAADWAAQHVKRVESQRWRDKGSKNKNCRPAKLTPNTASALAKSSPVIRQFEIAFRDEEARETHARRLRAWNRIKSPLFARLVAEALIKPRPGMP